MRNCLKIGLTIVALVLAMGLVAPAANAQGFIGYVSPQTSQSLITKVPQTCAQARATTYIISTQGATQHTVSIKVYGERPTQFSAALIGVDKLGNETLFSDEAVGLNFQQQSQIVGSGSYPTIEVQVVCSLEQPSTTFTLAYSGTSSTPVESTGQLLETRNDKVVFTNDNAGVSESYYGFASPYGSESGEIVFTYLGTGPSGSKIDFYCSTRGNAFSDQQSFPLSTSATSQVFPLPSFPCDNVSLTYLKGGASAVKYVVEIVFNPPGFASDETNATHIATATTTVVKPSIAGEFPASGVLRAIVVNTPVASETISIYDVPAAACVMTPASGLKGTVTLSASTPPGAIIYNLRMSQGICVVTSDVADLTVTYQ